MKDSIVCRSFCIGDETNFQSARDPGGRLQFGLRLLTLLVVAVGCRKKHRLQICKIRSRKCKMIRWKAGNGFPIIESRRRNLGCQS